MILVLDKTGKFFERRLPEPYPNLRVEMALTMIVCFMDSNLFNQPQSMTINWKNNNNKKTKLIFMKLHFHRGKAPHFGPIGA